MESYFVEFMEMICRVCAESSIPPYGINEDGGFDTDVEKTDDGGSAGQATDRKLTLEER
jgi:hypothetical protein